MDRPRVLVLRAAGTNCEGETLEAFDLAGADADLAHLAEVLADPGRLAEYAALVIPGGFSYGDDVAAGRVFGLELRRGLARELAAFVERGGYLLGVCNGFQVLVETGLFEPDVATEDRTIALYANASNHYECRWVTLETQPCACPWIEPGLRFDVPVAHAEGRFVVRDRAALERLVERRQVALRYVDPARPDGPAGYPANPNGSIEDIAGICDPTGRVLGLMPHPERNIHPWNHPTWTRRSPRSTRTLGTLGPSGEGVDFYRSLVEAAAAVPH